MGMGLLGAMGGLGEAGMQIGNTMMQGAIRSELQREHLDYLAQERDRTEKKQEEKRKAFVGELDKASAAKAAPDLANLSKAREIYSGLEGEDREAGLRAVHEAEGRVNADSRRLSGAEVARAGLLSGVIDGKDYMTAIRSDGSNDVKLAIADGRINMLKDQLEFRNKQLETTDATRRRGQDMRAETTQRGQDLRTSGGGRSSSSSRAGGSKDSDIADLKDTETRIGKITDDIFGGDSGKAIEPSTRLSIQSNAIKYAGLNKGLDAAKAVDLAMKVQSGDIKPANQLGFNEQGVLVSTETVDGYQLSRPVAIRSKEAAAKYMASLIGDEEFMSDLVKKDSEFISNFVRNGKLKALSAQSGMSSNDIENILLNGIDRFIADSNQKENASRHNIGREGRGMLGSSFAAKQPQVEVQNEDEPATRIGPAVGRGVDAVGQFFKDQTRRSATADELLARRGK